MASKLDTGKITNGPAFLRVGEDEISHTQGGVKVNITPGNRNRTVDVFGDSPVEVIHTGDECKVTAPLAQWTAEVLKAVYDPGDDQTGGGSGGSFLGIGRKAGYFYQPRVIVVIPVAENLEDLKAEFWRCVPVGQLELNHDYQNDRVFNAEFLALVDQTKSDGQLMGALYVNGASSG